MCGKPKRPRIPAPEETKVPEDPEIRKEKKEKAEQEETNKKRQRGYSSTIITSPNGVNLQDKNPSGKRTVLGG